MRFIDIVDERGRYCGLIAENTPPLGYVENTGHYSYRFTRNALKYMGDSMGLDWLPPDYTQIRKRNELIRTYLFCITLTELMQDEKPADFWDTINLKLE